MLCSAVHEVQLDFAVSRLKELQAKLNIKKASKKSDAGLSIVTGVIPNDPPHTVRLCLLWVHTH